MKIRSVEDAIALAEEHFEDSMRRFASGVLADGADVGDLDAIVADQREAFEAWKPRFAAQLRRVLKDAPAKRGPDGTVGRS